MRSRRILEQVMPILLHLASNVRSPLIWYLRLDTLPHVENDFGVNTTLMSPIRSRTALPLNLHWLSKIWFRIFWPEEVRSLDIRDQVLIHLRYRSSLLILTALLPRMQVPVPQLRLATLFIRAHSLRTPLSLPSLIRLDQT